MKRIAEKHKKQRGVLEEARCLRKLLLHTLRHTDQLFASGNNDVIAGTLYAATTRWNQTSSEYYGDRDYARYHTLFVATMKRYRKMYRQHVLSKYEVAKHCMTRKRLPWDMIGSVLAFV